MAIQAVYAVVSIIAAIIGAASSAYAANEQRKAAQMAEAIADDNARLSKMETEQTIRNLKQDQEAQQSLALARAAASGVEGYSVDSYMEQLKATGLEELEWLEAVGATRYRAAKASGQFAAAQARAGAWGSLGDAAQYSASAYSTGYKADFWG